MTFLERSPVVLGLVAAALLALVTVAALAVQGGLLRGGYEVTAEFADAAGLHVGDSVLIGGVRAGQVADLRLAGDRVEAVLFVEGHELTADTRARIVLRTLTGRRSVALEPSQDWSQPLADGDRIPLARTSIPVDVPEFGDVAEELLAGSDAELLDTFLRTLTDVTRGQREQVAALVAGGTRLTGVVNDQEAEVRELLRQLRAVSDTLASRDAELVAVIDDFGTVVGALAERRDDLRALLRETNATAATAAALVEDTHGDLDGILSELHAVTAIVDRHQVDLAEALAYAPDSVGGFASIFRVEDAVVPWGKVFVQSLGPAGMDVLVGCGGLVDRQLDEVFGPDPRPCEQQEGHTWPADVDRDPAAPGPGELLDADPPAPAGAHALDAVARRVLEARP